MAEAPTHPLRKWRTDRSLSMAAAGALVGTTRQSWYEWETGKRKPREPFMSRIRQVTDGLIEPNDFYLCEAEMARKAA